MMRANLRHYRFLRSRTLRAQRQPASIVWAGNVNWIRCFWLSWQRFCGMKVLLKAVTQKSVSLLGGFKASPVHISSHTRLIWSPWNLFRKVYSGIWISASAATRPGLRMNSLCLSLVLLFIRSWRSRLHTKSHKKIFRRNFLVLCGFSFIILAERLFNAYSWSSVAVHASLRLFINHFHFIFIMHVTCKKALNMGRGEKIKIKKKKCVSEWYDDGMSGARMLTRDIKQIVATGRAKFSGGIEFVNFWATFSTSGSFF